MFICLLSSFAFAQTEKRVPAIDELLLIETVGGAQVSPDGKWVAYTVSTTDFKQDSYPSQIWLANAATGETLQLTHGPKSSSTPRWSPDSKWLGFTSDRTADKNQVYAIRPTGGEALQLTKSLHHSRRSDWYRSSGTALRRRPNLSLRHLGRARRSHPQSELSRKRRLRRDIPPA